LEQIPSIQYSQSLSFQIVHPITANQYSAVYHL